ncbi:MAG: spore coat protein H [Glaciecola sp.]|jgi:spore coat protein H
MSGYLRLLPQKMFKLLGCFVCALTFYSSMSVAYEDTEFLSSNEHLFWHDTQDLPTIKLHFEEAEWERLLISTRDDREEVSCTFIFVKQGVEYQLDNIGIKLSGNTSFTLPETESDAFIQANYTLDFDEFVDDQTLSGISALKLKRFKDDSTFVHEPLSNQIMHNFDVWTAHSSNYVRLEIAVGQRGNNYVGIYRLNESVNRHEYIDKRFGTDNDKGYLWQGNYKNYGPALFSRINADWEGIGDFDQASFEYKGKGSEFEQGKAILVTLAENFTNLTGQAFEEYIDRHLNVPLFLKSMASEAVLGHWDGFWGNGNNYMFYIDEQQILHFIPFDTDNTLGTSLFVNDTGEQDPFAFGLPSNAPKLITKILAIKKYRIEYAGYLRQLVQDNNLLNESYALGWISDAHSLINSHLSNITGDNQIIADRPASWANQASYRLFELNTGKNWYQTRQDAVLYALTPPVADAGEDIAVEVGQTVQLNASKSSDVNGEISEFHWSNGLEGSLPTIHYDSAQTITLTLTVTDTEGNQDTDTVTITVTNPPAPPVETPTPSPEVGNSDSGGSIGVLSILLFATWLSRYITKEPI